MVLRVLPRWFVLLGVLALFGADAAVADEAKVRCYLVDARVHVALVSSSSLDAGELLWRDTVTGETGEAPFIASGDRLFLAGVAGQTAMARVLPDLAILVDRPPWASGDSGPALGIALN